MNDSNNPMNEVLSEPGASLPTDATSENRLQIQDVNDLWKYAIACVKGGEASEPVVLRRLIMLARDQMPEPRPDDNEVTRIVRKAMEIDPGDTPSKPEEARHAEPDPSEAALVEYLAASSLKGLLRWSRLRGAWMDWTGTHWRESADKVPVVLQANIRRAVADGIERRRIDPKIAPRLESAASMRGVAQLLSAWQSVWMVNEIDPPGFIACPQGVLDLKTGEWMRHDSKRPITKICPVDPGPSCPLWLLVEDHLRNCLGPVYPAVHRFLGSALLGRSADRRLLWLWGKQGGDGKSTLVRILGFALGEWLAVVPAEVFGEGARGAHGHELASGLTTCRLAVALEVKDRLNWALLKTLSGGDAQRTKRLHGRAFTAERPPLLVLVANEAPKPPDNASAERVISAELFPPTEPDERLVQVLSDGGPQRDEIAAACLSWLMAGCADYLEQGLGPIPLCVRSPTGLDRWWDEMVGSGSFVPGGGWSRLADIREWLPEVHAGLHNRVVAAFLRTQVECRRHNSEGVRYGLSLRVKHGEA